MFRHFFVLLLICFFVLYNFFYTGRYAEYPWWHEHGNDIDATHAATTIGLLNNSELTFVYHPAATIYALHGIVYRMLALQDPAHQRLLHLREVKDYHQAIALLETSTRTSRILTVIEAVLFLILFYFLIVRLGGHWVIAFLVTFYLGTSHAFLQHICMVRAEILNMLFFLGAFYLVSHLFQKKIEPSLIWACFIIPAGIFLGWSVFSKIQIGPVVLGFLGLMIFYLLWMPSYGQKKEIAAKIFWFNLGLSLVNLLIMPWWALKRPAFLTPEVISFYMTSAADWKKVYGPAPESFFVPIFVFLMVLVVMSACLIGFKHIGKTNKISGQFIRFFWFFNLLISGGIISIYLILFPVSVSFTQYIENTQRLVYAVLTNVSYGGFLSHRSMNFDTFEKIWNMHANESSLFHMNILYFVILVGFLSLYCFFKKGNPKRWLYGFVFFLLTTAVTMDIFATMRSVKLYPYYAFYSLSFFALGLAVWLNVEYQNGFYLLPKLSSLLFSKALVLVLGLHVFGIGFYLLSLPRSSGKSDQDPMTEYINTRSHAGPFWRIVDESIKKNS